MRQARYSRSVVREIIEAAQWDRGKRQDQQPAPFVNWLVFTTFTDYVDFIGTRSKRLYKDQQRRRLRLAEQFGELIFQMHDTGDDVLKLAFEWKIR